MATKGIAGNSVGAKQTLITLVLSCLASACARVDQYDVYVRDAKTKAPLQIWYSHWEWHESNLLPYPQGTASYDPTVQNGVLYVQAIRYLLVHLDVEADGYDTQFF